MQEYLHEHPLVLIAALAFFIWLTVAIGWGWASLRFLKALRRDAPEFWRTKLGDISAGQARLTLRLTPRQLLKLETDAAVVRACERFKRELQHFQIATWALLAVVVVLLLLSGVQR